MNEKKIWITGLVGAAVACSACVVAPALLLLLGGGALAFLSSWIGVVVPFVILSAGLVSYLWYRGRKKTRAARQAEQAP